MRLKPPERRRINGEQRIVAPGHMLIFVSGHYPIFGTQMLYFQDPALSKRAELPPPTDFYTLENGCPVRQRSADRMANRISKAEIVPPSAADDGTLSPMEKAFFEELESER
jgi:type IV secretion system protein VirD4